MEQKTDKIDNDNLKIIIKKKKEKKKFLNGRLKAQMNRHLTKLRKKERKNNDIIRKFLMTD